MNMLFIIMPMILVMMLKTLLWRAILFLKI